MVVFLSAALQCDAALNVAEEARAAKRDTPRRKYTNEEKAEACHEAALRPLSKRLAYRFEH